MAIEEVRKYFAGLGIENRIREFEVSSATVELAAAALDTAPERIAKTLSFIAGNTCILVVTAGDARIDNRKYRETFGVKAKMPAPDDVPALVGHAVGGVCPFAVKEGVRVFLDVSLQRFTTVFPACGSSNSAVELTCDELFMWSGAEKWVDVCRLPEG